MACIFCLAISRVALLRVGRRGGFSFLFPPDVTVTVCFQHSGCFRRCPVSYICSETSMCSNIAQVSLSVFSWKSHTWSWDCLAHTLGTACCRILLSSSIFSFLWIIQSWEEQKEVVHFRQPWRKMVEDHASRITHCAPYRAHFLRKQIDWEKYSSKPIWISLRWLLVKPPNSDCSSSKSLNTCPRNILGRQLIWQIGVVVTVQLVAILNFLRSEISFSGRPSFNVFILMLYVLGADDDGFLRILTLMMWVVRSSSTSNLIIWIGGWSIRAWIQSLSHVATFCMVWCMGL